MHEPQDIEIVEVPTTAPCPPKCSLPKEIACSTSSVTATQSKQPVQSRPLQSPTSFKRGVLKKRQKKVEHFKKCDSYICYQVIKGNVPDEKRPKTPTEQVMAYS